MIAEYGEWLIVILQLLFILEYSAVEYLGDFLFR